MLDNQAIKAMTFYVQFMVNNEEDANSIVKYEYVMLSFVSSLLYYCCVALNFSGYSLSWICLLFIFRAFEEKFVEETLKWNASSTSNMNLYIETEVVTSAVP